MPLLNTWGYLAVLVTVVVHRLSWLGLLIAFRPWHLTKLFLIVTELVLREGFQNGSSSIPSPILEVCDVFSNRVWLSNTKSQQRQCPWSVLFGESVGLPWLTTQSRNFSCSVLESLSDNIWPLGRALISHIIQVHWKQVCTQMYSLSHTFTYIYLFK